MTIKFIILLFCLLVLIILLVCLNIYANKMEKHWREDIDLLKRIIEDLIENEDES